MKAIFYDRKNNCEVTSEQLVKINLQRSIAVVDDEGCGPGTPVKYITDKYGDDCLLVATEQLATLGYKSLDCPKYQNWDRWCNLVDLVFLRLE